MNSDTLHIVESEVIDAQEATALTAEVAPAWCEGLEPKDRPQTERPHSIVVTVLIALFAVVALTSRHLPHIFASMKTEMLGVRRRNNAFDSHTSGEAWTLAVMILLGATCEAIIVGIYVTPAFATSVGLFGATVGLMTAYYVFQLTVYSLVGYVFTDPTNAQQWRRGFNLMQGLLGFVLMPPALVLLFYPSLAIAAFIFSAVSYGALRIMFIFKGFRIFYTSEGSLVYFILYLCALEIIPPLTVYSVTKALSGLL